AEGYGDFLTPEIFESFDLRTSHQAERNLIEDRHENTDLLAAKHRVHRRAEGRRELNAACHQRLNVDRIAAEKDQLGMGYTHFVVESVELGGRKGKMRKITRRRHRDINRLSMLAVNRR